jgi:hypothetical protein
MARTLTFSLNEKEYPASPVKLERKKLYGWSQTIALDEDGRECTLITMDETGTMFIPKGGMGLGLLSPDNEWVERSSLKAVKLDGSDAELVPSSFSAPIALKDAVDFEEFFDHTITAVYQLDATEDFIAAVGEKIYSFSYNYRDSYAVSPAFLVVSSGTLFMLAGYKTEYEMLGLEQAGAIDEEDVEEDEEEESDGLDFSMGL